MESLFKFVNTPFRLFCTNIGARQPLDYRLTLRFRSLRGAIDASGDACGDSRIGRPRALRRVKARQDCRAFLHPLAQPASYSSNVWRRDTYIPRKGNQRVTGVRRAVMH